ncbi:hypothetical protein C2845_PM04G33400 [Panicum miliaceum]|uniref:Uncharacterized protein n=1 Tax=Panicum miliaceum TaxID=4540 RepID=A0A3L6QT87_PANMI|nr:hypothetical protein C2845_PM04G33400 [Panicum miliaceum]
MAMASKRCRGLLLVVGVAVASVLASGAPPVEPPRIQADVVVMGFVPCNNGTSMRTGSAPGFAGNRSLAFRLVPDLFMSCRHLWHSAMQEQLIQDHRQCSLAPDDRQRHHPRHRRDDEHGLDHDGREPDLARAGGLPAEQQGVARRSSARLRRAKHSPPGRWSARRCARPL